MHFFSSAVFVLFAAFIAPTFAAPISHCGFACASDMDGSGYASGNAIKRSLPPLELKLPHSTPSTPTATSHPSEGTYPYPPRDTNKDLPPLPSNPQVEPPGGPPSGSLLPPPSGFQASGSDMLAARPPQGPQLQPQFPGAPGGPGLLAASPRGALQNTPQSTTPYQYQRLTEHAPNDGSSTIRHIPPVPTIPPPLPPSEVMNLRAKLIAHPLQDPKLQPQSPGASGGPILPAASSGGAPATSGTPRPLLRISPNTQHQASPLSSASGTSVGVVSPVSSPSSYQRNPLSFNKPLPDSPEST